MIVLDVIVPIPLPLSAILILVIGESNMFMRRYVIDSNALDLGFELFVAVCLVTSLSELSCLMMLMTVS
jgi:hypothetical protein